MKKTIRSFSVRAAMTLLTVMVFALTAQTAWAVEPDLGLITATVYVDDGQPSNWNPDMKDGENYNKLVDGNTATKYGISENAPWVEFHYESAFIPKGYALWTANDSEGERNPTSWIIKAKAQPSDGWTTIATVDNSGGDKLPMANNTRTLFSLNNSTAYKYFRFEATLSGNGGFQLAELQFFTESPTSFIQYATITGVESNYNYTGNAINITPIVTNSEGTVLTLNSDYTVTIKKSSGQALTTVTDEDNYTLTITGKNTYTGSKTLRFSVCKPFSASGSGTELSPYIIRSVSNWNEFATSVNNGKTYTGKYIKLAANIGVTDDPITKMVGTSESRSFRGTFNGGGYTLTVSYSPGAAICAPFRYIKDATIKNLIIDGTINNSDKQNGGIAGYSYGKTNIKSCLVTVSISCGKSGDCSNGGLVAHMENGVLTFTNCAFKGKLLGGDSYSSGGFLGWRSNGSVSFTSCLYDPVERTMGTSGSATFNRNEGSTFDKCYYTESYNTEQGEQTSATGDALVALLGSGWENNSGNVVPSMDVNNIVTATVAGLQKMYEYNNGTAIAINYTVTDAEGHVLSKSADYTATIKNSSNQTVATVTAEDTYTLTITGTGSKSSGYYGNQILKFFVSDGIDLSTITTNYVATNGEALKGTLGANVMITIEDGATVTLKGVTINGTHDSNYQWAGITCEGDATIVLADGSINTVKGFHWNHPGIHVPAGKTLTILGNGELNASNNGYAAGIGGGYGFACGNIVIKGGIIKAHGSKDGAGIGGYAERTCGSITIEKGITYLEATRAKDTSYSIGRGSNKVTIFGFETGPVRDDFIYDSSIRYTIKFNNNGGTGSMSDFSLAFGEMNLLPDCGFTKAGSVFAGWSTAADGNVEYYNGHLVRNLASTNGAVVTLYAIWKDPAVSISASTGDIKVYNGQTLSGTGGVDTRITIADGATVTLSGVNNTNIDNKSWAGITCEGSATIILANGTTNAVKAGTLSYAGIYVPANKTLTIQGSGSLEATGGDYAAGIGGAGRQDCGNITISGGSVTATGGLNAPGIGCGWLYSSVGTITISGGTVIAVGGNYAAGIGSGGNGTEDVSSTNARSKCGDITITGGSVTATGGTNGGAGIGTGRPYRGTCSTECGNIMITGGSVTATGGDLSAGIGSSGNKSKCGTITIVSGTINATKGTYADNSIGAGSGGSCGNVTIGGVEGAITESPYNIVIVRETYTVHYDANGGMGTMSDQTINRGIATPLTRNAFTRSGFVFIGWSETPSGNVAFSNVQSVTDLVAKNTTKTLYAQWISTTDIPEGLQIDAELAPTEVGFYYVNMPTDGSTTTVTISDVNTKFKIYDDGGKNGDYTKYTSKGYVTINVPTGYKIILQGSINIHWQKIYDNLRVFDGNSSSATALGKYDYYSTAVSATSTGNSITLFFDVSYSVYGDYLEKGFDITATIEPITYSVSFNANGGTGETMAVQNFTGGTPQNLRANSYTPPIGYVGFAGWATSADGEVVYTDKAEANNLATIQDANVELFAKWTNIIYTINFKANGGTGDMSPQIFAYDVKQSLSANVYTLEGYVFAGWATSADGKVVYADKAQVCNLSTTNNASIDLYAKWKKLLTNGITIGTIADQTYTGSEIKPAITVKDGETDITGECTITYSDNTNAGTATVTITANASSENYGGSATKTFAIKPKAVTVTAVDASKVYGAADPELTATVEGTIGGDAVSYTLSREAGSGVGEYTITPAGETIQGNYTLSYRTARLTITPKTIGISWSETTTFDCDGSEKMVSATATGLVGMDACRLTITGAAAAVGTYTATVTALDNINYQLPESGLTCDFEIVRKIDGLFADGNQWTGYVAQEDLALPAGLTAYAITAIDGSVATVTAANYLPQGVPVLLSRTDKTANLYRASAGTGTEPTTNLLRVATAAKEVTVGECYVLYQDEFVLYGTGTLPAGTIYLPVGGAAGARRLSIGTGGDTTSMEDVRWQTEEGSGDWYSIDGRKLDSKPTKKGLYIHNGKKEVVK